MKIEGVKDEIETFRSSFREKLLADFSANMQTRNTLEAEISTIRFKQETKLLSPRWTVLSIFYGSGSSVACNWGKWGLARAKQQFDSGVHLVYYP